MPQFVGFFFSYNALYSSATAVETFQQLKTTFTPFEKLEVLVETFKEINKIGQEAGGSDFCWSMDNLFPVFVYIGQFGYGISSMVGP